MPTPRSAIAAASTTAAASPAPSLATASSSSPALPAPQPTRPFAYLPSTDGTPATLAIDDLLLPALADTHGTPLYLYSARNLRHRLALFQAAFAPFAHTVCYAVKASSSLALLRLLAEAGAGFDIVSGGELERVRRAHAPALRHVVFSGVGKQPWELDAALDAGILLFNVESAAELDLLSARAHALGRTARFALRVNPDVFAETHPYISTGLREHKFGIDIGLARKLYRHAATLPGLQAAGVSVHIGSQIRDVQPFAEALRRVVTLVRQLRSDGHNITHIDAGGGLGIDYEAPLPTPQQASSLPVRSDVGEPASLLANTITHTPDSHLPKPLPESAPESQTLGDPTPNPATVLSPEAQVAAYAAALRPALEQLHASIPDLHLLLEPGRFLVAQAGGLLTRVLSTKQNGTKRFVITDAAMNDLIRPALYEAHHEIVPVTLPPAGQGSDTPVDVVGPVCESGDFFAHDRPLPPLAPGDLLLLLDAGAYGMSQSSNYNTRPRPAELLIDGGDAHLIRRRETLDHLLAPDLLP